MAEIRKSICTICEAVYPCGIDLHVDAERIVKVEGDKDGPANRGTLCSKGAAFRQYVYSQDRVLAPLKRIGPKGTLKFAEIDWEEAMHMTATSLLKIKQRYGPQSVVFFAGFSKWMRPFLQRLAYSFGSPNYCTESSTCHNAAEMAWRLVFGTSAAADFGNACCLLVWSRNPFYTQVGGGLDLLEAKERGLKIIVVDPRVSPMAAHADIHLQLRPGTDGALALAMGHVIIKENLYDQDFVREYTHGFTDYRQLVKETTPEWASEATGVPADLIRTAARLYASCKPAAFLHSASPVVHHTNGVQNYRAAMCLIALTGNFDIAGGNVVRTPSYLHTSGTGFPTRSDAYAHVRPLNEMAPRIGEDRFPVWSHLVDEAQAMAIPQQVRTERPYPIKGMLAFGINHRMWPDSLGMADVLSRLDFVCNAELFLTDSCRYVDVVLPACTSVERSELRTYPGRMLLTRPAIPPHGQSRPDVDIIFDLASRLGLDDPLLNGGYNAALDWILEPSGVNVEKLKANPAGVTPRCPEKLSERKYRATGFATPTGKVEFSSCILANYSDSPGHDSLPVYLPPRFSREASPELFREHPFILNTGSRLPMFVHSRTFRMSWTQSLRPEAAADLNPTDAASLGIRQNDPIEIATPKGAIRVLANVTGMVAPGVVHMCHGYQDADVNTLIEDDYLDPLSGFPGFKSLLCRIRRVPNAEVME